MNFLLPELPYPLDHLEPLISRETLDVHYNKHHQAYVNNLNKLTEGSDWKNKSFEELIRGTEGGIFNNASQVWNHAFYWYCMSKNNSRINDPDFKRAILEAFGSIKEFKDNFMQAAVTLFGSGWAWLVLNLEGKLSIMQGPNAWNPIREGCIPLLTCDVWEHAYYLDYKNRRPDYAESFWLLVDWKKVEERFHSRTHLLDCC
jgi:Fe-Mn family superoxide dismutase